MELLKVKDSQSQRPKPEYTVKYLRTTVERWRWRRSTNTDQERYIRLHHFRDYVVRKEISIHAINTNDQPADFLTKALNEDTLKRHRKEVLGW